MRSRINRRARHRVGGLRLYLYEILPEEMFEKFEILRIGARSAARRINALHACPLIQNSCYVAVAEGCEARGAEVVYEIAYQAL